MQKAGSNFKLIPRLLIVGFHVHGSWFMALARTMNYEPSGGRDDPPIPSYEKLTALYDECCSLKLAVFSRSMELLALTSSVLNF